MKRHAVVLVAVGILAWTDVNAQVNAQQSGQTAQTTFRISARVNAVCEVTASDLDFGTYTAQNATPLQATTMLRATCTPQTTYNVGLNEGTSPGATINTRHMRSGTSSLNYQLYSDAQRTTIWGNTTGTDTVTGVGTGLAQDHTVYGSVPAAQVIPAGSYSDTITVRIYY